MSEQPDELWRAYQVADWLGYTMAHVLEMAADGRIPSVKIGRAVFFRVPELIAWLDDHSRGPKEPSAALQAIDKNKN